jgi:hypothetical protein
MDRRSLCRDGLLAAAVCVVTVLWALRSGVGAGALVDPRPAAVGVVGTVALELVLLRFPDLTRRLWRRPAVRAAAAIGTFGVGVVAVSAGAAWVAAVLVWGLVAYLVLVGVVVGLGSNPLGRLVG